MIIGSELTIEIFGLGFYNSVIGLKYQKTEYGIRKLNLNYLLSKGIKTYADFSRLFHQYISFVDPMDIYNYWEGITFKEIMNDYVGHIIAVLPERK